MAVDREKIINDMSQIRLSCNDFGLIDFCGVLINELPTDFWNSFADRLTAKVNPELLEATEYLLYNAAHECGYHTGYGIINSEEWKAVVAPMLETKEDTLHGLFAVSTALGWGKAAIVDLKPNEKMLVKADNYYETDILEMGAYSKKSAYMLQGVCAAFMDLVYGGEYDPRGKTGFDTFKCKQLKGIECGDAFGEFLVTRNL
jgi:hypothetical protein